MLAYFLAAMQEASKTDNFKSTEFTMMIQVLVSLLLLKQISYIIMYEVEITSKGSMEPDRSLINKAQSYFNSIFWMTLISFFLPPKTTKLLLYMNTLSVLYWFNNSYYRIAIFGLITPG